MQTSRLVIKNIVFNYYVRKIFFADNKLFLFDCHLGPSYQGLPRNHPAMKKARESVPKHKKDPRNEIKRPEQILKQRKINDKKRYNSMKGGNKSKGKGKGKSKGKK